LRSVGLPIDSLSLRKRCIFLIPVVLITIAVLSLLFFFNPADLSFFPPCPFHYITGLHCPGCGSLRAFHQLLRGHFLTAFDLNPLMVLSLPFLGYGLVSVGLYDVLKKPLPRIFTSVNWGWISFFVIVIFWIMRNIPFFPFDYLAP